LAVAEDLALALQEIFTVIVRVRSNRSEARDAEVFRARVRGMLKTAEREAVSRGYTPDDARLASFAVVAFLDESLLGSGDPVFGDWKRMPLQQELFKTGNAGEEFFNYLELLLKRRDAPQLGDLLEVYHLCLLLGFRGRYGGIDSLYGVRERVAERLRVIRGPTQPLSTSWAPPAGPAPVTRYDPWVRRLALSLTASFLLAVLFFVGFRLSLNSGVEKLSAEVSASSP